MLVQFLRFHVTLGGGHSRDGGLGSQARRFNADYFTQTHACARIEVGKGRRALEDKKVARGLGRGRGEGERRGGGEVGRTGKGGARQNEIASYPFAVTTASGPPLLVVIGSSLMEAYTDSRKSRGRSRLPLMSLP